MLTVRPESLETMQRGRMAEADRLLVEYAQKRFPSVFTPQNAGRTLKLVEQIRERAASYAITREDNVATMMDLSTMYGLNFDKADWATRVLSNSRLAGPDKVSALQRRIRRQGVKI